MATTAMTLYQIEEERVALLDTLDLVPTDEEKMALLQELAATEQAAITKRDSTLRWRQSRLLLAEASRKEAARLLQHADRLEKQVEHLDSYLLRVLEQFVPPPKKGPRKLECNLGVLKTAKNPDSVVITNEAHVPARFKTLVITLPATRWEDFTGFLADDPLLKELIASVVKTDVKLDKVGIKAALKDGPVSGADMKIGENRLVVE